MDKLLYTKTEWKNRVIDEDENILEEGTPIDEEKLNKIEDIIEKLVTRVNVLTDIIEGK